MVKQVLEKLRLVAKGEHQTVSTEKRKFGVIVFAAVSVPGTNILSLLKNVSGPFFSTVKH